MVQEGRTYGTIMTASSKSVPKGYHSDHPPREARITFTSNWWPEWLIDHLT